MSTDIGDLSTGCLVPSVGGDVLGLGTEVSGTQVEIQMPRKMRRYHTLGRKMNSFYC